MYNEALIVTFSYIISTLLNQSSKLNITWSAIVRFYTLNWGVFWALKWSNQS
jgi:hypothetical protein